MSDQPVKSIPTKTAVSFDIAVMATKLDGGIGRNKMNLVRAFVAEGIKPVLLLERLDGPFVSHMNNVVPIIQLPTTHPWTGAIALARLIRRLRPRVMLPSTVRLSELTLRARGLSGCQPAVFANVHNTYSVKYANLDANKWRKRQHKISRYYPRCDGVICVSQGAAADMAKLSGIPQDRLHVIYNPMATDELQTLKQAPAEHPWFDDTTPVILGAGRLETAKNFPLLIDAFERVRQHRPARLAIAGDGSQRGTLLQRIEQSPCARDITLLGHQENPFRFMARAAVFVSSSDYEGLSNVLIEALACHTPTVATDCPFGPREILEAGKWGKLVPTQDPVRLATAIEQQLDNPIKPTEAAIDRFRDYTVARQYMRVTGLHNHVLSS